MAGISVVNFFDHTAEVVTRDVALKSQANAVCVNAPSRPREDAAHQIVCVHDSAFFSRGLISALIQIPTS